MTALTLDATWDPRPQSPPTRAEHESRLARCAAAVWRHPSIALADAPVPVPGDGEVLIRVRACGVCGSDAHCFETDGDGYVLFTGPARLPVVMGHEFAGDVVQTGRNVQGLRVGDAVTAESVRWCGVCTPCRSGEPNQCERVELLGLCAPGAFGEYVAVNERFCWKLDALRESCGSEDELYETAALIEPIGCAYNGMFVVAGGFRPGAYVAIYGAGPIGLGALMLARAAGAAKVFVFDPSEPRNALARSLGADHAVSPEVLRRAGTSPGRVIRELTAGHGADLQIEAAGAAHETWPEIELALAGNGKVVYLGRASNAAPVRFDPLVSNANAVFGSRGHAGHGVYANVIRLLASGRMPAHRMITARFPLARALDAIRQATARTDGKIMVRIA